MMEFSTVKELPVKPGSFATVHLTLDTEFWHLKNTFAVLKVNSYFLPFKSNGHKT